jgi:hypothetical protein
LGVNPTDTVSAALFVVR